EGDGRWIVVIKDGVSVSGDRAQGGVGGAGERNLNRLVVLIEDVVDHGEADVLAGHTGDERECPVGQCVIDTSAGSAAARDRVVDCHRLPGRCGKRYGQVDRGDILQTTRAGRVE